MARPLILDGDLIIILNTRVAVSRETGAFTLRDLMDEWEISKTTLYRYTEPNYRVYSREYAHDAYHARDIPTGCYKCGGDLFTHKRCPSCTILLHGREETCGATYCL